VGVGKPAAPFEAAGVKNTTYKKDASPIHYNHKFASMKAFAQHLALKDVRLRTVQSYYRQMRLVAVPRTKNDTRA